MKPAIAWAVTALVLSPTWLAGQQIEPNTYRPGAGITQPVVVREVKPVYPPEALGRGVEGTVMLEAIVETDGSVSSIRTVRSLDPTFDEAAVTALKEWQFKPGIKSAENKPVRVVIEVEMSFSTGPLGPRLDSTGVFKPGEGVTVPQVLKEVRVQYPENKQGSGIQGIVTLECVVRTDGRVGDVRVSRSLDPDLDRAAIVALKQWRFSPGERQGKPVPVQVEVEISFTLR